MKFVDRTHDPIHGIRTNWSRYKLGLPGIQLLKQLMAQRINGSLAQI